MACVHSSRQPPPVRLLPLPVAGLPAAHCGSKEIWLGADRLWVGTPLSSGNGLVSLTSLRWKASNRLTADGDGQPHLGGRLTQ
jgi:hypothetical protein